MVLGGKRLGSGVLISQGLHSFAGRMEGERKLGFLGILFAFPLWRTDAV